MKKRMYMCLIVFCILLFVSCDNSPSIRRIEFPVKGSMDADLSEVNFTMNSNLKEYKVTSLKVIEIEHKKTDEEIEYLRKVFEIEDSEKDDNYDGGTVSYVQGQKKLTFYENGMVQYVNYPINSEMYPLEISDEEAIKQAEAFLLEWELIPDDFRFEEIMEGIVTVEDNPPIIHKKMVIFRRYIGDIPVIGNCHISVSIISSGIGEVSLAYKKYINEQEIKLTTISDAIKMIKSNDSSISITKEGDEIEIESVDEMFIKDIELVYVEQAYNTEQTHVQPCYRFIGDAKDNEGEIYEFSSVVRAVPDKITYVKQK